MMQICQSSFFSDHLRENCLRLFSIAGRFEYTGGDSHLTEKYDFLCNPHLCKGTEETADDETLY